jgi:lysophospholipase L1-like esterase
MPPELLPVWDTARLMIRARCTTGVRLRFVANTTRIALEVRYGANSRPLFQGSILARPAGADHGDAAGQAQAWGPTTEVSSWSGDICGESAGDGRDCSFDIWLPNMVQTDLVALEVDDGCAVRPAPVLAGKWLALGDSITQGMISSHPARMWAARCAIALDLELVNAGVGGAMLDPRLHRCVPSDRYRLITVAFGTNEWYNSVPPGAMAYNATQLLSALVARHPDTPVVLITPPTMAGEDNKPNLQELLMSRYREALCDVAAGHKGVHVVNGRDLMPDAEALFTDGIHPNDRGMAEYAANLVPQLQRVLPS